MCYTGRCKYENYFGSCTKNFNSPNGFTTSIEDLMSGNLPLCELITLKDIFRERINDMKILNKNKKLKYSKMMIDYNTYEKICEKYGTTLNDHILQIELYQQNPELVPDMKDVSIMFEVYSHITKIIRKRR